MQAFDIHNRIVEDYKNYLNSFTFIKDERIREKVDQAFDQGTFLPEALIQFNPSFKIGSSLRQLEEEKGIHPDLKLVFGDYNLYHHQVEALQKGIEGKGFVVTSGTGSGKSLTYLATVFNRILQIGEGKGLKAILVYPMNALINSQEEEIKKYEINYLKSFLPTGGNLEDKDQSLDDIIRQLRAKTGKRFPITYSKYTGQEDLNIRESIKVDETNIILTNYMMLELIMTRNSEKWMRESMAKNLEFLVFDELHTYRGRQGSDVSMLIRRIKRNCNNKLISIGTSATMASDGTVEARKKAVAEVASQIFGTDFTSDQIINETLATCTSYPGKLPSAFDLQEAIGRRIDPSAPADLFVSNPLAIWLENKIALNRLLDNSLERAKPRSLTEIAKELEEDSGDNKKACENAILNLLQWSEHLNIIGSKQSPRKSYLPFKIHQFISQTGNVYVTLDNKISRQITLDTGRYLKLEGKDKPIFPVLFSRYTGYDFICVKKDFEKNVLVPRNPDDLPQRITKEELKQDKETGFRKTLTVKDYPEGYILLDDNDTVIWSESEENKDNLPESWYKKGKDSDELEDIYKLRIPSRIYFDSDGNFSEKNIYPTSGWYIPAKLLIDPTAGVIFDFKTNENTKLMRLGNEGRSTATTIISFSIIKALHEKNISAINQKLLSFTDNRQDASLQAGHFNDFLTIGRLRSAIYHALKNASNNQLTIDNISDEVFKTLKLKEIQYALYPSVDAEWGDEENEKAIKDYLLIRIFYDLKRGWRYNTPNLEQCGLVYISYSRLDEFCEKEAFFTGNLLFEKLSPGQRKEIVLQLLNYFRTSFAFEHPKLLQKRAETEERLKNKLDENKLWSLDTDEKIESPYIMLINNVGKLKDRYYTASIGTRSYFGRYISSKLEKYGINDFSSTELTEFIKSVCEILERGHFLTSEEVKGSKGDTTGYRLRVDKVVWKLGNGNDIIADEIRVPSFKDIEHKPNSFFKKFYQQDFNTYSSTLIGKEHTGQLSNSDRIDREEKFRKGDISALYCSPTMELGIDISELNVVHMRNVPPNPANYAQRSGRAGRSGQAALVYTYCSNGSPHDRNYFSNSQKMVSGSVVPPKIDLTNEELVLGHFNAYLMMELGLEDIKTEISEAVDVSFYPELPIKEKLKIHIENRISENATQWASYYKESILGIKGLQDTNWFTNDWFFNHAKSFLNRFDSSFNRWRSLYRTAKRLVENARLIIDDPTITSDNPRKNEAKREEKVGLRQIDLLLNNARQKFGNDSEFYVYRYLASEGFLPGYNFTRLPVRSFMGYKHMDKGAYISRPRFIALKEFGPNNVIYHNGGKFRINKMQVTQADSLKQTIKICKKTGYAFLNDESKGVNNDPITQEPLVGQDQVENMKNLLELCETEARPQERISCEEEERVSTGFEIDQYFSFSKDNKGTRDVVIKEGDQPLLRIIYDQSARLIQINKRWRTSNNAEGFLIGKISGRWKKASEVSKPNDIDPPTEVRIFTTGTSDILYVQPIKELKLTEEGISTLSFALKRAIEKRFQIEESEIGVWIMGYGEHKNILIYEAAEGSLGILSQLVESSSALRSVFEEAYQVLHFDIYTKTDTRPDAPKASYDNLLSYFNQRYHDQLDRFAVKEALERLINCDVDLQQNGKSQDEHYKYLLENYDLNSSTERPFIDYLYKNGFVLPDKLQFNVPGCYVNADFVYKTQSGFSLVFCDGSVHDHNEIKTKDRAKRQCCIDQGLDVIEWHYSEPIEKLIERRKDIFRKIK
jgi:superfamily II DNA/RNA helicase